MPTPLTTRVVQIDPGPHADLDGIRPSLDQIAARFFGGDVADDQVRSPEIAVSFP